MANSRSFKRLTKRSEFQNVLKAGKRLRFRNWLVINLLRNKNNHISVGWTVPSHVGPAVTRNRVKRWLREYLAKKWTPPKDEQGLVVHFFFQKKDKDFYKEMSHKDFDEVIEIGLRDVEKFLRAHT